MYLRIKELTKMCTFSSLFSMYDHLYAMNDKKNHVTWCNIKLWGPPQVTFPYMRIAGHLYQQTVEKNVTLILRTHSRQLHLIL